MYAHMERGIAMVSNVSESGPSELDVACDITDAQFRNVAESYRVHQPDRPAARSVQSCTR